MAYLKTAAILTRIREAIEDSAGSLRTVPSGRFEGGLPQGARVDSELARAFVKPRVESSVVSAKLSIASSPRTGNVRVYVLDVEVRVLRIIRPIEQMSDDDRVALQALAAEDADVLAQALEYPGNLTQTTAATATDLVSGCMTYVGSRVRVGRQIDDGAQPLDTTHTFSALAISRPATS